MVNPRKLLFHICVLLREYPLQFLLLTMINIFNHSPNGDFLRLGGPMTLAPISCPRSTSWAQASRPIMTAINQALTTFIARRVIVKVVLVKNECLFWVIAFQTFFLGWLWLLLNLTIVLVNLDHSSSASWQNWLRIKGHMLGRLVQVQAAILVILQIVRVMLQLHHFSTALTRGWCSCASKVTSNLDFISFDINSCSSASTLPSSQLIVELLQDFRFETSQLVLGCWRGWLSRVMMMMICTCSHLLSLFRKKF